MLEPSPRLKKDAKRIGCDANHIILADLILSGYSDAEAYDIAYSENVSMSAKRKIESRERILASEQYKRAYEVKKTERKYNTEKVELRDKDSVVRDLNTLINQTTDVKLKAELLVKLADIQQMKKTASGDEDPVQFYFPIDCDRCPLLIQYNAMLERRNVGVPRDKWDLEVRPDEMQRLIEQAEDGIKQMRKKERDREKAW